MEQQDQTQEPQLFGLTIDPVIKAHLYESARWGKFLAIAGFIMCGLIVILGITFASTIGRLDRTYGVDAGPSFGATLSPFLILMYIIFAIICFFPCLFLLRFSNKMKTALSADNQTEFTLSFQNLKVLFRYVGVITIIVLGLYVLGILFGGLGWLLAK